MTTLAARLRSAERILVIHIGALGDTLHQVAAIHAVRRANPAAEIHCLIGGGQQKLFELFPWIDRVWIAPTHFQPGRWREALGLRHRLRTVGFDIALAFWPRNTIAAWLWLSGADWRVSRSAQPEKPAMLTRILADEILEAPWFSQSWAAENCEALARAGLIEAAAPLQFGARIDSGARRAIGIDVNDDYQYIHVSPFSTADRRDPPIADLASLLNGLHATTSRPMVISTAGDARQLDLLNALLALLNFTPRQIFPGTLTLDQFAAVVAGCALHVGPDSGGVHMAMVLERPILAWFRHSTEREKRNLLHFAPPPFRSTIFVSLNPAEDALHDLPIDAMVAAAARLLDKPD